MNIRAGDAPPAAPRPRRILPAALLLVLAAPALAGCSLLEGPGPRPGPVAFILGRYRYAYPASFERTWPAAVAALRDLHFEILRKSKDLRGGTIEAAQAEDTTLTMRLEPETRGITNVTIRVGVMGERKITEHIHERISARLGIGS